MTDLAERLKHLRKEKHITQKTLASKLRVHISTYNQWEKGNNTPQLAQLNKLVEALDTSADYLLGYSHISSPPMGARTYERGGIRCKTIRYIDSEREEVAVEAVRAILKGMSVEAICKELRIPDELSQQKESVEEAIFSKAKHAIYENMVELEIADEARDHAQEKELETCFKREYGNYHYNLLLARVLRNPMHESFEYPERFMPILLGEFGKQYFLEVLKDPGKIYKETYKKTDFRVRRIGVVSGYYTDRIFKAIRYGEIPEMPNGPLEIYPMCLEPSLEGRSNVTFGNYLAADFIYRQLYQVKGELLHPIGYKVGRDDRGDKDFSRSLDVQHIQNIIARAEKVDIVFCGIGSLAFCEPGTAFHEVVQSVGLSKEAIEALGAVGDFMFHLIYKDGELFATNPLTDRLQYVGVEPHTVRRLAFSDIDWRPVVCTSSGIKRKDAVLACLRGGYVNTLLVDDKLAEALLESDRDRDTSFNQRQ